MIGLQERIDNIDKIPEGTETTKANQKIQTVAWTFCDLIEKDIKLAKGL